MAASFEGVAREDDPFVGHGVIFTSCWWGIGLGVHSADGAFGVGVVLSITNPSRR